MSFLRGFEGHIGDAMEGSEGNEQRTYKEIHVGGKRTLLSHLRQQRPSLFSRVCGCDSCPI